MKKKTIQFLAVIVSGALLLGGTVTARAEESHFYQKAGGKLSTGMFFYGNTTGVFLRESESYGENAGVLLSESCTNAEDKLVIDNIHIYPGMTEAYQNGYTPLITDGRARVVVPFLWQGETPPDGKQIRVTLEFPGSSGQVFLGRNYQMQIREQQVILGTELCPVYLLDVLLDVKSGSPAGTYPITVKTSCLSDHQEKKQDFLIYITLPERSDPGTQPTVPGGNPSQTPEEDPSSENPSQTPGTDPSGGNPSQTPGGDPSGENPSQTPGGDSSGENPSSEDGTGADGTLPSEGDATPEDEDPTLSTDDLYGGAGGSDGGYSGGGYSGGSSETKPDAAPRILVESCEISPGEYRAGDRVDVLLSLYNTSSKKSLRNIRLTYSSATGEVMPVDAAPDIYRSSLGKGESFEEVLRLKISDAAASSSQPITLTMEFEDTDGNTYTSSETIYLSLTRDLDFRVDTPILPLTMEAMTSQEITLNLFNVGSAKVKNVFCQVEMEGVIPKGSTYVGDMEPNSTGQAVLGIVVGDLTYSNPESKEKYGKTQGTITVTYEDEQGNSYEQTVSLKSEIVKPEGAVDESEPVKYESQWWVSIVAGLILLQALITLAFWLKRRHQ